MSVYPIKRGTLYSTVVNGDVDVSASFAPLYFLKELRLGNSDTLVTWIWATDQNGQDVYNSSDISYSGESTSTPIYTRLYNIRRDVYEATPTIATGSALTALIAIKVTAGGTGYSRTDTVNIGGAGGATAELVVDTNGAIISIIVTKCGSGYDSASLPAITFTTSTGSAATAVAIVQPKTAVLVSQKKQELGHDSPFTSQSQDSPYSSEYVRVIRIYETLPGPVLTNYQIDQNTRIAVLVSKQIVPNNIAVAVPAGSKGSITIVNGTSSVFVESEAIDSVKSIAITSTVLDANLPASYSWETTIQASLPDILDGIDYLSEVGSSASTPTGTFEEPVTITWSGGYSYSGETSLQIRHGHQGSVKAIIDRSYSIGPPTISELIDLISESSGTVVIRGGRADSQTAYHIGDTGTVGQVVTASVSNSYRAITIPPVITAGISTSGTLGSGPAFYDVQIPPSSPTAINSGDELVYRIEVTELRLGVFMKDVITITVPSAPPLVTTTAASSVGSTTVTLNGAVNPNGLSTSAHFEIGTTTAYGTSTAPQALGAGGIALAITQGRTGLTSATTYHYRIVATNSMGTRYGRDKTFTTS